MGLTRLATTKQDVEKEFLHWHAQTVRQTAAAKKKKPKTTEKAPNHQFNSNWTEFGRINVGFVHLL